MSTPQYVLATYAPRNGIPVLHLECLRDSADQLLHADEIQDEVNGHLRHWMSSLKDLFGESYSIHETNTTLTLCGIGDSRAKQIHQFTTKCIRQISNFFGEQSFAALPGKILILAFTNQSDYYDYIQAFYPDGNFGTSAGIQIREGYPHIAIWGNDSYATTTVIAHELLHLAGMHLELPLWLDEGLAMMFQNDMTGGFQNNLTPEDIYECKDFWRNFNFYLFWSGDAFEDSDDAQKFSYMLAEIFTRNLVSRFARRKWFSKKKPTAFVQFALNAYYSDNGYSAAEEYLKIDLDNLATQFLADIERSDWY